jgi:hypothetical protein
MPQLTYIGGVGAIGSAMACFFHPSKPIRDKWPQDNKCHLTGVIITGEAKWRVARREQNCYLVRIPEINDDTQFYFVKKNFKIDQPPLSPFESKAHQQPLPAVPLPSTLNAGASVMQWPASMGTQEI